MRIQRVKLSCERCGATFERLPRQVAKARFCSYSCSCAVSAERRLAKKAAWKPTVIEAETYTALTTMDIPFVPSHRIGRYIVDAFLPTLNTVVECLGDFYHVNPAVYPDGPTCFIQRKHAASDPPRLSFLKGSGYRVIELWEKDIREHGSLALLKQLL